jgi:hypothetical protein
MSERINEHDMTKKMMDVIRGGYKSKLIIEAEEDMTQADPSLQTMVKYEDEAEGKEEPNDTIDVKQGDAVFRDELKKLQAVDPRVKITNFKIYPVDENVIMEGIFMKRESEESGIHFKMSLAAGEVETSMQDIELDDEISDLLNKIKGYYSVWSKEWATKLANEYKPEQNK